VTRLFLKSLNPGGAAVQPGATVCWPLPQGDPYLPDAPGEWTPLCPDPVPCTRGWHLARNVRELIAAPIEQIGPEIWLAKANAEGPLVEAARYAVAGSARLLRRLPWD
jgi:hypothetical protein